MANVTVYNMEGNEVGTSMTMIFGAVSHRSSGLSMSLDSTLETFTFGNSSYIDVIAVCKDISFNFLSYSVFCSIFKSVFFYKSLCCNTSFVKVTFFRFVNRFTGWSMRCNSG